MHRIPRLSVWVVTVMKGTHGGGGGVERESEGTLLVKVYSHWNENHLRRVQGDNYGGNFVLFSKLIFKAIPEAHLLLLG